MSDFVKAITRGGRQLYKELAPFRVSTPPGKAGNWAIQHVDVVLGHEYLRHCLNGREPGIGKHTVLSYNSEPIMSDTAPEITDLVPYLSFLTGHVLMTGLGLGMVVHNLTKNPQYQSAVRSITVIERDRDVIKLSAEHYTKADKRVTVIRANAYTWTPPKGQTFDCAWHDIWPTLSPENLPQMTAMRRHYKPFVRAGNQFCWGEEYITQHMI